MKRLLQSLRHLLYARQINNSAARNTWQKYVVILAAFILVCATSYFLFKLNDTPQKTTITNNPVVREYQQKLPTLKAAAAEKPTSFSSRTEYARALYVTGDKELAKKEYEAAIRLNDRDASTYNRIGNVYRDLAEYSAAVEAYRKASMLDPALLNPYINLATMQAHTLKKPADAVATYEQAAAKVGQTPEILLLLASAYEQNGQNDKALATYRSVLSKDSQNATARQNIERLSKR